MKKYIKPTLDIIDIDFKENLASMLSGNFHFNNDSTKPHTSLDFNDW